MVSCGLLSLVLTLRLCVCVCVCVCQVTSPHANMYHFGDHVDSGNFAFTASESGDYSACFWVQDTRDTPSVVTIEFGWGIVLGRAQWCWMTRVVQVRDGDADN